MTAVALVVALFTSGPAHNGQAELGRLREQLIRCSARRDLAALRKLCEPTVLICNYRRGDDFLFSDPRSNMAIPTELGSDGRYVVYQRRVDMRHLDAGARKALTAFMHLVKETPRRDIHAGRSVSMVHVPELVVPGIYGRAVSNVEWIALVSQNSKPRRITQILVGSH